MEYRQAYFKIRIIIAIIFHAIIKFRKQCLPPNKFINKPYNNRFSFPFINVFDFLQIIIFLQYTKLSDMHYKNNVLTFSLFTFSHEIDPSIYPRGLLLPLPYKIFTNHAFQEQFFPDFLTKIIRYE